MEMLLGWSPIIALYLGLIILGIVKRKNRCLLGISIAWTAMPAAIFMLYSIQSYLVFAGIEETPEIMSALSGIGYFLVIAVGIVLFIISITKKRRNYAFLTGTIAWAVLPWMVVGYIFLYAWINHSDPFP